MSPIPHPKTNFTVSATSGRARVASFETAHGTVQTPAFMPVATRASLKGVTNEQLEELDPDVLVANTYHLHQRPGEALIDDMGGLHRFTGWDRPWLTDSGGYQVFSLGALVQLREDGVKLKSHLDGSVMDLTPQRSIAIQEALGADVIMAFDHCVGLPADRAEVEAAVHRTTRWTEIAADARTRNNQLLFGIVQGGDDLELRTLSATELLALELPGYAIGGLAVGETRQTQYRVVRHTADALPSDKPRYLMGVGHPLDMLHAIASGVDMFDCVLPTRNGRRGYLYTHDGVVRIGARKHERDESPLDVDTPHTASQSYSRGYLRHLFKSQEQVAVTLGSLHNLAFLLHLVRRARETIREGTFDAWREAFTRRYTAGDEREAAARAADPDARLRSQAARETDERLRDARAGE